MDIMYLLYTFLPVVAASEESSGAWAVPLILLLSGFIYYGVIVSRYRNADKRHMHERETASAIANLQTMDSYVQSKQGLSNAKMSGANHSRVEGALNTRNSQNLVKK